MWGVVDVNRYGRRALWHWQEFRPGSVGELDDAEAFFLELGADVQRKTVVRWTVRSFVPRLVVGESSGGRSGRLLCARHQPKAQVLRSQTGPYIDDLLTDVGWPAECVAFDRPGLRASDPSPLQKLSVRLRGTSAHRRGEYV